MFANIESARLAEAVKPAIMPNCTTDALQVNQAWLQCVAT
jgi:hypothetical protein